MTAAHEVTVDESTMGAWPPDGAWKAHCACGWYSRWVHADEFLIDGVHRAFDAATAAGADHLKGQR